MAHDRIHKRLTRAYRLLQMACLAANNGDTLLTVAIAPHQARTHE
jgi:hypothetical protein